jgi:hypothetical protein
MSLLQLGPSFDTMTTVLVGILLGGIAVAIVIFAIRRTSSMSDELSKEAKAKFDALMPKDAVGETLKPPLEPHKETQPLRSDIGHGQSASRSVPINYSTQRSNLEGTSRKLQEYATEISRMREREDAMRTQISSLSTELSSMKEQLAMSNDEARRLREIVDEQKAKLQSQERDFEIHKRETDSENQRIMQTLMTLRQGMRPPPQPPPVSPQAKSCPNCARPLEPLARFCDGCGLSLYSPPGNRRIGVR